RGSRARRAAGRPPTSPAARACAPENRGWARTTRVRAPRAGGAPPAQASATPSTAPRAAPAATPSRARGRRRRSPPRGGGRSRLPWCRRCRQARSRKMMVRRERQELDELPRERDLREELLRVVRGLDARQLVAYARLVEASRLHPRPHLRPRDLRGRRILHQVVDRRRADAAQPRVEVAR